VHGLDQPLLSTDTGYFQVVFPGTGQDIERIAVPEKRLLVTPAVEERLNERQRAMVSILVKEGQRRATRYTLFQTEVSSDNRQSDYVNRRIIDRQKPGIDRSWLND